MVSLSLDWIGGLHFRNGEGSPAIELQSAGTAVASPPQALAYALMGCMAMDVVDICRKARQPLGALTVRFEGEREASHPRRFVTMALQFDITGDVTAAVIDRAIELSRTKYCSVWHSLRPDIQLTTAYTIHPAAS